MFYYASKIFWFFTAPTNVLATLAVLGAILVFTRWRRAARVVAALVGVGLALFAISPIPKMVLRPLEDRFPVPADARPIAGIVVLGGAVGFTRGQVVFNDAATRMTTAVALAFKNPSAKLVFTGGDAGFFDHGRETEASAAGALFHLVGIPADRVVLEDRSRNTRENALFTSRLIAPKPGERWLLITSAYHMPRAVGCFRAVGLDLEPYPVDFRTDGDIGDDLRPFTQSSDALRMTDLAVREWIGLVAYRLAGYTDALFPAPRPAAARGAASAAR